MRLPLEEVHVLRPLGEADLQHFPRWQRANRGENAVQPGAEEHPDLVRGPLGAVGTVRVDELLVQLLAEAQTAADELLLVGKELRRGGSELRLAERLDAEEQLGRVFAADADVSDAREVVERFEGFEGRAEGVEKLLFFGGEEAENGFFERFYSSERGEKQKKRSSGPKREFRITRKARRRAWA